MWLKQQAMKKIITIIFLTFMFFSAIAQTQIQGNMSMAQLAVKYYSEGEYDKAAPLFKDILKNSVSRSYYKYYLTCLFSLKQFSEAEKSIKDEMKAKHYPEYELLINYGYLLKLQDNVKEAENKYNQALRSIPANNIDYTAAAGAFTQWKEYEYAKKTYLLGREKIQGEPFAYELARINYTLRDYESMMQYYLDYLKTDENLLPQVESSIASAMALDIDNEMKVTLRTMVLKRMQAEPDLLAYSRLFIWFLIQEQNFPGALRQSIALDKRVGKEDASIMNLAMIASNNHDYDVAREGYEYLMSKGQNTPLYYQSYILNLQMLYRKYEEEGFSNLQQGQELAEKFKGAFAFMNYSPASYPLVKYYAHLLAFSLRKPEEAIAELKKGIGIRGITQTEIGDLKTEMADIYVYSGDPWEATLVYSQVIEENKDNPLGDAVKLKKAKLSYYLGSFSWAQAQLDVIKASTSKLTSNDAFELSLLISSNLDLDTTSLPLEMFARADFYFFRNEDSLALAVLDSIETTYPYNTLVDDILFRRATIRINNGQYENAVADLQKVVSDFSYESLADDALFLLGEVYGNYLKNKEKAMEAFSGLMTSYPGSIYVVDARKRYRELRGDKATDEYPADKESQFFNTNGL